MAGVEDGSVTVAGVFGAAIGGAPEGAALQGNMEGKSR